MLVDLPASQRCDESDRDADLDGELVGDRRRRAREDVGDSGAAVVFGVAAVGGAPGGVVGERGLRAVAQGLSVRTEGFRRGGLELPSRRRRPALAAASAAAVLVGAALGAEAFISAGHRAAVLVTARPVAHGEQLSRADVSVAQVSASGVAARVPSSAIARVANLRAKVSLPAGVLLTWADLTSAPALPTGDVVVGVSLRPGQAPAEALAPGEVVQVRYVPSSSAAGSSGSSGSSSARVGLSAGAAVVPRATVYALAPPATTGSAGEVVSLVVPGAAAGRLVGLAAEGEVAVDLLAAAAP